MSHVRPDPGSAPAPLPLPDNPNLDWLRSRRSAARRTAEANPAAQLADAQFDAGQRVWVFELAGAQGARRLADGRWTAVRRGANGDVNILTALLDKHPDKLHVAHRSRTSGRCCTTPRSNGHLAAVDLLLKRGLDVNTREKGDNTYAMHWAAAAGQLDVVRRLADAGGDVVGHGDDHELEVIGWATCWDGCDDDAHRAVADFLVSRGARHHIFSAIAMNLADEVRRIVAADSVCPQPAAESQRESPDAAALRRAEESPGDGRAVARARRRSAGSGWLGPAGGGVCEIARDRSARDGEDPRHGIAPNS